MKAKKRLGIWMDHNNAHLMEYNSEAFKVDTISSHIVEPTKSEDLKHNEKGVHNKENQTLHLYYKNLMDVIKNYEEVVLFGPTAAKTELHNLIKKDHRFDKLFIETKSSDKMSFSEQHAFIKNYFSKLLNAVNPLYL
jgi:stalled ribosome rescue protein Dom34